MMNPPKPKATWLLALAIAGHLLLLTWFRELFLWSGVQREAEEAARVSAVSIVVLLCAGLVVVRGKPPEKAAAFFLCLLPVFCLLGEVQKLLGR
ncbi:MAG: hypothetical protein H7A46_06155 [Verrucomicrobiales bacterium]|nr:hypothetical protein [Verrucomicrobiales bacterium]